MKFFSHSATKNPTGNTTARSETPSSESQRRPRLPSLELVEQSTTVYIGQSQYLIRAYVQIDPPRTVLPFEIIEVVPIRKAQFKWRFAAGTVKLFPPSTADHFRACDTCLKYWASTFLQPQSSA